MPTFMGATGAPDGSVPSRGAACLALALAANPVVARRNSATAVCILIAKKCREFITPSCIPWRRRGQQRLSRGHLWLAKKTTKLTYTARSFRFATRCGARCATTRHPPCRLRKRGLSPEMRTRSPRVPANGKSPSGFVANLGAARKRLRSKELLPATSIERRAQAAKWERQLASQWKFGCAMIPRL